jgi:hypothetical protein
LERLPRRGFAIFVPLARRDRENVRTRVKRAHSRLRASFCTIVLMCSPAKAAPAILIRRVVRKCFKPPAFLHGFVIRHTVACRLRAPNSLMFLLRGQRPGLRPQPVRIAWRGCREGVLRVFDAAVLPRARTGNVRPIREVRLANPRVLLTLRHTPMIAARGFRRSRQVPEARGSSTRCRSQWHDQRHGPGNS